MASQGMTALANFTVATAQATVTFSNIPATFRDLRLVVQGSSSSASDYMTFRVNADTGSNYSYVNAYGNGSTAQSQSSTTTRFFVNNAGVAANEVISGTIDILDYSATDKHKSLLTRGNDALAEVGMIAGRWANASAITSIVFSPLTGNFNAGSTFALYGVSA